MKNSTEVEMISGEELKAALELCRKYPDKFWFEDEEGNKWFFGEIEEERSEPAVWMDRVELHEIDELSLAKMDGKDFDELEEFYDEPIHEDCEHYGAKNGWVWLGRKNGFCQKCGAER